MSPEFRLRTLWYSPGLFRAPKAIGMPGHDELQAVEIWMLRELHEHLEARGLGQKRVFFDRILHEWSPWEPFETVEGRIGYMSPDALQINLKKDPNTTDSFSVEFFMERESLGAARGYAIRNESGEIRRVAEEWGSYVNPMM